MKKLISDTVAYLRQEGHLTTQTPIKKAPLPKVAPKPVVKKQEPVLIDPPPPPPPTKKAPPPMHFQTIQKHLPHVKLVEKIPSPKEVAIIVFDKEDLPFLKNLARAIQGRLCSVKLLSSPSHLESFTLVLTQEKIEGLKEEKQILIAKASIYETNPTMKKALWTKLCQLLK